jgi:hypothetical protein
MPNHGYTLNNSRVLFVVIDINGKMILKVNWFHTAYLMVSLLEVIHHRRGLLLLEQASNLAPKFR